MRQQTVRAYPLAGPVHRVQHRLDSSDGTARRSPKPSRDLRMSQRRTRRYAGSVISRLAHEAAAMRSDSPSSPADSPGRSSAIGATARRPRAAPHRSRKRWKPLARLADRPANGTAGDVAKPRGGSNRRLLRGCGPSNWSQDRQIPEEFRAPRRSRLRLQRRSAYIPRQARDCCMAYPSPHGEDSHGDATRCHLVPHPPAEVTFPHRGRQYQLIHISIPGAPVSGARAASGDPSNAKVQLPYRVLGLCA